MVAEFDVAARLAEGRPAADRLQQYVWACHLLGYQHPDLTAHAAQVLDGYGAEEGLDLRALDADCAALDAAAKSAGDALALQRDQLSALGQAWRGTGAAASETFLRRHGAASTTAAAALRTAADALAALRDRLWQALDRKVATVQAVDAQAGTEWLAAARTVTGGAGDRAAASELLDQQVKPFVDNAVRVEWLAAMRAATTAVEDAYQDAIAALTGEPGATFAVPDELGPVWQPSQTDVPAPTVTSGLDVPAPAPASSGGVPGGGVQSVPAVGAPSVPAPVPFVAPQSAAVAPPAAPMPAPAAPPMEPAAAPMDSAATAPAMAQPAMPALGGGGLPDVGGGMSGFGRQLSDALSGWLGSLGDALPEDDPGLDELEDPELEDPDDDTDDGLDDDDPDSDDDEDEDDDDEPDGTEPAEVEEPQPAEPEPEPTPPGSEPTPVDPPPAEPEPAATAPPPEPPPPPGPPPDPPAAPPAPETPCEIAADELPQAGQ